MKTPQRNSRLDLIIWLIISSIVIQTGCKENDPDEMKADNSLISINDSISYNGDTILIANFDFKVDDRIVTFQNLSRSATSFMWKFPDEDSSVIENPTHVFDKVGSQWVSLSARRNDQTESITQTVRTFDSSIPGGNWSLKDERASFSERYQSFMVSFQNKIWIIGGNGIGEFGTVFNINEVWTSTDAINWSSISESLPFNASSNDGSAVVFKDKIWLIGRNIWCTSDGLNWEKFSGIPDNDISKNSITILSNQLIVTGGSGQVWKSENGIDWEKTGKIGFANVKSIHSLANLNGKLIFVVPTDPLGTFTNTGFYISEDGGMNWKEEETNLSDFRIRAHHLMSFNNALYLFFGSSIFTSTDGIRWKVIGQNVGFSVENFPAVNHNGELFSFDGNRIWVSK